MVALIEAKAPGNFISLCRALGIHQPTSRLILNQSSPADARTVIYNFAPPDVRPVLNASDFYLAESGQVIFRPARLN